jgi:hypothetical protein
MLNKIYDPRTPMPTAVPSLTNPATRAPATPAKTVSRTAKFVGNRNSKVYHYPSCKDVQNIQAENLVEYAEAPEGKHLHEGCSR